MKMKTLNTLAIAAIVTGPLLLFHSPASAQSGIPEATSIKAPEQNIQQEDVSNFIKVSGIISTLNQDSGTPTLIVENKEKMTETHFPISDKVLIFNSGTTGQLTRDSLTEGLSVDVYYDKNKPILLIYPAVIPPEIVIVHDKTKTGQVKVGLFDENLVSLDNQLKLKLDDDTMILNEKGETIGAKELNGKELIVFYDIATKSIPAQTAPSKIIALDIVNQRLAEEIEYVINDDHYIKDGTKMIPLRKVAEHFGYEVKWQQATASVLIAKQNRSFQIFLGKETYHYNNSEQTFKAAPEITNGKTYVSEEFFKLAASK